MVFVVILTFTFTVPTFAADGASELVDDSYSIIYLEDGSYITTVLHVEDTTADSMASRATTTTKKGSKTVSCKDSDGTVKWTYVLTGEFSVVQGVSATCTSATYTQTIYDDEWSFSNGAATKSGNVAYGVGTFKQKFLFITIETANIDISITCDVNGNLS